MTNPICEKCKQTTDISDDKITLKNNNCDNYYNTLQVCMKINDGNISSCRKEWNEFRICFEKNKLSNNK